MANSSAFNLESMVVPVKAATVYAAHESSLYLPGAIIPAIAVPSGSITAQVPFLNAGAAAEVDASGSAFGADDFTSNAVTDATRNITARIFASRTILRDIGGIDPAEVGRVLGNSVSKAFDQSVTGLFTSFNTNAAITGSGTNSALKVADMFRAVAVLRAQGVYEQLFAVLHPAQVFNLMNDINTSSFAASDAQNEAMRNGFVGTIAGVQVYQSGYVTEDTAAADHLWNGLVFGADAMRIAMFKDVDIEVQRRASAVGNDIVASLHAGVGIVDASRGVLLKGTGITIET